jgi:hypothetical protein
MCPSTSDPRMSSPSGPDRPHLPPLQCGDRRAAQSATVESHFTATVICPRRTVHPAPRAVINDRGPRQFVAMMAMTDQPPWHDFGRRTVHVGPVPNIMPSVSWLSVVSSAGDAWVRFVHSPPAERPGGSGHRGRGCLEAGKGFHRVGLPGIGAGSFADLGDGDGGGGGVPPVELFLQASCSPGNQPSSWSSRSPVGWSRTGTGARATHVRVG